MKRKRTKRAKGNCPVDRHRDCKQYEQIMMCLTPEECQAQCGVGLVAADFRFHRDHCLPKEFKGLEMPKTPLTAKEKAGRLHKQLDRLMKITLWQADKAKAEGKEIDPKISDAAEKFAGQQCKVIELSAKLEGLLAIKEANANRNTTVNFNLPVTNGKSAEQVQRMVTEGVMIAGQIEAHAEPDEAAV